jgi:hypothetical protein
MVFFCWAQEEKATASSEMNVMISANLLLI